MMRKYTPEQREYARQRRNYMARVRYHAKKAKLSPESYKQAIEEARIPTAKEAFESPENMESYLRALSSKIDKTFVFESLGEALARLSTKSSVDEYIEAEHNSYDVVSDNNNIVATDLFDDWFEFHPGVGYVSRFTGEIFDTLSDAKNFLTEYDIENAIDEGKEIINAILDILNDRDALHQRKFDESGHSVSMSIRPDQILDELQTAISQNARALALQLHYSDENIIDLVQESLYYGDKAEEPISRLYEVLTIDPQYETLIDDYMNAKESPYSGDTYTGSYDEGWLDT